MNGLINIIMGPGTIITITRQVASADSISSRVINKEVGIRIFGSNGSMHPPLITNPEDSQCKGRF